MASQYLQQLDAITSTLGTYLIPISDDPSGTGRLKKITFTNLLGGTLGSAAYTASSAYDAAGAAAAVVSDIAYDATSWNGVTGIAPSKNAVRDYLNTLGTAAFVNIGTDTTLAANSDSIVATQKATKTYVDTMVTGLLEFKGSVDCSANPNYSSANKGDAYYVNVAGKIGGASGESVEVGDVIVASADNAGGTEASVGTSWFVMEHNLVGAAVTSGTLAQFAATTSAQLAGVISDETGSGSLVFSNSPTLITPILGVASATSLAITGTSGAGYLSLIGQASTPAEPAAGTMLIYSETEHGFTRLRQHNEEITNLILGQDNAFVVRNTSGASIAKGSVVYITGSTGHTPNVSKAQADSSVTTPAVGILVDAIANNAYGQAMFTGVLSGINTSTLVSGEPVFLSTTVAGGVTTTRPSGTTNIVQAIGTVLVVGVGNGEIKVAIAPALLNSETGTNAATWTGRAVVATSLACPTFTTSSGAMGFTPASGANFNITLATTGDFAVNASQLYVDTSAGNVGIGTTSPSARVHAISTTEQLRLGYDSSNYYSTTVSSAGEVTFDSVGASSSFTFSDVITLSVATPLISFKPTVNTQDCGLKILNAAGSAAGYLSIVPNTIGTNSKFLMYVGGAAAADIKLTVDDDGVTNIKRDASNYVTITPSSVGLITFDAVGSGAAFSFSDSVAIGVATPLYPLHVNLSSGDNQLYVSSGTPSSVSADSYLALNSCRSDTGVGHTCKIRSVAVSAGKADLAFLTQPSNGVYTERIRIDNAGYVGIGTTAPTSALSVVGVIKIEASSQRRPALTSSNFGYSANYRTLMLGSSSTAYNTADTGAVTLAFGVDVSANAGGTFTGDGSELLFRNVVHFITPNSGNTNYQKVMTFNDSNVGVGFGATAFGASAASVFGIKNGTEPSTSPADMIQLYSVDLSAGNATLGLRTETAVVTESVTSDRTLSIRINGTTYKLCLKA